ncbi:MAG: four helix bundle protein [Nitrospirota bacterium]
MTRDKAAISKRVMRNAYCVMNPEKGQHTTHKDLDVWKMAMDLAVDVYSITGRFPKEEQFGLAVQTRRSAVSIPSNIAEGAARNSRTDYVQFLSLAFGSVAELETQLLLAAKLDFMSGTDVLDRIERVRHMLLGLLRFVKRDSHSHHA